MTGKSRVWRGCELRGFEAHDDSCSEGARKEIKFAADSVVVFDFKGAKEGVAGLLQVVELKMYIAQVIIDGGIGFFGVKDSLFEPREGILGLIEAEQDPAETVEKGSVFGFDFDGLFNEPQGFLKIFSAVCPHIAEVIEGFGEVGSQLEASLEERFSTREVTKPFGGGAELKIEDVVKSFGFGDAAEDFSFGKMSDSGFEAFRAGVGEGSIKLEEEAFPENLAGTIEDEEGLVNLVLGQENQGEVIIGGFEVGLEEEGAPEHMFCLGKVAFFKGQGAEEIGGTFTGWTIASDGFELSSGVFVAAVAEVHGGEGFAKERQRGQFIEEIEVEGFGLIVPLGMTICVGHSLAKEHILGIVSQDAIESFDGTSLGSGEVFWMRARVIQIEFCDGDEEVEIGIGLTCGVVEHLKSRGGLLIFRIEQGEISVSIEEERISPNGFAIGADRGGTVSLGGVGESEPCVEFGGSIGEAGGTAEELDGVGASAGLEQPAGDLDDEIPLIGLSHGRGEVMVKGFLRAIVEFGADGKGEFGVGLDSIFQGRVIQLCLLAGGARAEEPRC